jgi:pyochelin biosynthesis protein PchC
MSVQRDPDLWIRRLAPASDSHLRLVCFPFAGGAAGYFHWLAPLLGPDVEVLGVQYPGRQGRRHEPVIEDIQLLADQIYDALTPWQSQPLAFLGHSMGAVVAFEVARRSAWRGWRLPLTLIVSGRRAPSRRRVERLDTTDDDALIAELRSVGGTDPAVLADEELLQIVLPAVRGDFRAIYAYRGPTTGAVLDIPITAIIGDRDPQVTTEEANAWREYTNKEFSLHVLPGGHFFLQDNATEIARYLKHALASHIS